MWSPMPSDPLGNLETSVGRVPEIDCPAVCLMGRFPINSDLERMMALQRVAKKASAAGIADSEWHRNRYRLRTRTRDHADASRRASANTKRRFADRTWPSVALPTPSLCKRLANLDGQIETTHAPIRSPNREAARAKRI
jgi:hypothetical protein